MKASSVWDELVLYVCASSLVSLAFAGLTRALQGVRAPSNALLRALEWSRVSAAASAWFSVSVSFTIFNKYFMGYWKGEGFPFPILATATHMLLKVVISRAWLAFYGKRLFAETEGLPPLPQGVFCQMVLPIGVLTALDVMLSNLGIMHAPLSLYTAIKSTAPVFCFFFGVLLHIETFSVPVFLSLLGIAGGLAVAVISAVDATWFGVVLCLSAAASGGLRWTLTQMLLKADSPSSSHFMVAIYRFAPSSALAMLPLALSLELPGFVRDYAPSHSSSLLLEAGAITCAGGLISFLLIAVELRLLALTSSLTLGVLGTLKEALQISMGMFIFGEHLGVKTTAGLGVSVLCGCLYRIFKQRQERADSYSKLAQDETGALLLELSSVFSRTDFRDLEGEEEDEEEEAEDDEGQEGKEERSKD